MKKKLVLALAMTLVMAFGSIAPVIAAYGLSPNLDHIIIELSTLHEDTIISHDRFLYTDNSIAPSFGDPNTQRWDTIIERIETPNRNFSPPQTIFVSIWERGTNWIGTMRLTRLFLAGQRVDPSGTTIFIFNTFYEGWLFPNMGGLSICPDITSDPPLGYHPGIGLNPIDLKSDTNDFSIGLPPGLKSNQ